MGSDAIVGELITRTVDSGCEVDLRFIYQYDRRLFFEFFPSCFQLWWLGNDSSGTCNFWCVLTSLVTSTKRLLLHTK